MRVLIPARFADSRGFFSEIWSRSTLVKHEIDLDFVQENHSLSIKKGTIRGLHYQTPPYAQAKLVRCGRGRLMDIAVDIRIGSPTFGKWVSEELSCENGKQLLIPIGFLHGFVTLEPLTEIVYKCTNYYAPNCDKAVRFDDPEIGIDWETDLAEAILSEKDKAAPALKDVISPFRYIG